ncbi:GPI inositol-deacylase [Symbiodinium microadriaticum]|uniref:GPI inositol-deacylase n=1 Tax=Symbiodinium microadriaticum TaxID=2951 RepID=A0A1Q9D1D7_SYMMI|nr:GPI inositol-deacylase [Symbiodinium microadriaticum]
MAFGPSFETLARSYPDGETTNAQYQTKASGLGRFAPPGNDPHAMWLPAIASLLVCVLGAFLAYGPYQDDRTWNLVRNTVSLERVGMRALEQSHFRLYGLRTGTGQRTQANSDGQVLFVPGHGGAWTQTINLASYVAKQQSDIRFFALDFHASASALHWSVVEAQADFTVAAVIELAKPQRGPLVLLCHSMGGLVALESLRLLGDRRSLVAGVVLVSAPTAEHPLLLEARFAYRAAAAREEAWTFQSPPIVSISGGATDALVPMTATILPQRPQAATLLLPAARDVYSSFSHVNVLFSRHSLHALSALLRGALAGRLLRTAESLRSPLSGLLQPTQLVAAPSPWSAQRLMAQVSDSTWTTLASDVAFSQLPEQKAHAITLLHELEAGVLHLLPAPESGGTLTLMLLEEPRPIKRTPEPTTRGENFDPKDVLDCSAALSAVVTSGGRDDSVASLLAGSAWMGAAPVKLQYPSKACFYQIPSPSSAQLPGQRGLAAIMVNAQRSGSGRRIGWVQWQLGAAAQDLQCNRAGENLPVLSWLASVAWPVRCRLPAGRGLLTRVGLSQSWRMLPFLPLDVRLVQEEASGATAATWRPPVLLLLTADNHTRMAALPFPTEPRQLWFQGWAAESRGWMDSSPKASEQCPIAPLPSEIPWPRFAAAPVHSADASSSDSSDCSTSHQNLQIWLGPASMPGKLEKLGINRSDISSAANCESYRSCVRLSDYMRLRSADPQRPDLSFGSLLHVGDGCNALCLICSYHKPPARSCKNGVFCDFCHLHDGRRNSRRRRREATGPAAGRMSWADTEVPVLEAIRL